LFALLAAGFIGAYASKSFAHGSHWMSAAMDSAQAEEHVERMVKHLAVEVDATPEQREKLSAIAHSAAQDVAPVREKMAQARKQVFDFMNAEKLDRTAIETLRAEQIALLDSLSKRLTQALADAVEVLNLEQRKKLAERMQHFGHDRLHRFHG
jgi:Spy/CpxP family protein refolding chaperone